MKTAVVMGAGGFIGSHLVTRLKKEGYWVRAVDLKYPEFTPSDADEFLIYDLRDPRNVKASMLLSYPIGDIEHYPYSFAYNDKPFTKMKPFDEVYQLAADMGGAGYIFTGEHDADVMNNSALINLNVAAWSSAYGVGKVFYSSSACIYPSHIQKDVNNTGLREQDAWPANPDSSYGVEKIFSEQLYLAYYRNYGLNVRIARFHNIYGEYGTYQGGKEKAPAATCRKVIQSKGEVEVWGDGQQTRSFLYIDDCIDAVRLLMESDYHEPINIGSEEMVSINHLTQMTIDIAGMDSHLTIKNIPSNALGVRGRNSDNNLIREILEWEPKYSLEEGMEKTFYWIKKQINGI